MTCTELGAIIWKYLILYQIYYLFCNHIIVHISVLVKRGVDNITNSLGKKVKIKLARMEKDQNWLMKQIEEETGLFIDSSYLHKIFKGERHPEKIIMAINKILDL